MHTPPLSPPTEIVLVGGGHSHVQVLRAALMRPFDGARLTVIVDDPVAVYSGMVPGVVAGQYTPWEVEIDVRPLAKRAGARIVVARATRIDAATRRVHLEGRPPIPYDLCSVNVGSTVAGLETPGVREYALPTRPIAQFVSHWEQRVTQLGGTDVRVVVVGAGAGGVELAFCARERLIRDGYTPHVTLLTSDTQILGRRGNRPRQAVLAAAQKRGIQVRTQLRVTAVHGDRVETDGEDLPADLVFWVTGAVAQPLMRDSGFDTDARGFAWVDGPLRVRGQTDVFAVGDCAVPEVWPDIPKAGVYAVREGPVLIENLRRALRGIPAQDYKPQSDFLTLFNLGDGTAIGAKWGVAFEGAWAFTWKDHIDRVFMHKFQALGADGAPFDAFEATLPSMPEMQMVCGGCAAKVGQTALEAAIAEVGAGPRGPEVLVGLEEGDDAAVISHGGELLVQSVDVFTAFTDDPWLVGKVAALNAISDVVVQGAIPRWALAIVTIPEHEDEARLLADVLRGARDVLDASGVALLGGHTTVGDKLMVGFSVTGTASDLPPASLEPGQVLILTRGLGTGVLWRADGLGKARGRDMQAAVQGMLTGNGEAAQIARAHGATAMTDITGFGLAGHLGSMCRRHGVSATVEIAAVPVLAGVHALLAQGVRSTFHDQNREAAKGLQISDDAAAYRSFELLFDPQTAGGLVAALPQSQSDAALAALADAGIPATVIGSVAGPRADGAALCIA